MAIARPDRDGAHQGAYNRNKKRIYATQDTCAICGKPVDMELKFPHPLSKTVDHIIPVAKGGHPSDLANLQLAHFICNRLKSDKLDIERRNSNPTGMKQKQYNNRNLPHALDWEKFANQ